MNATSFGSALRKRPAENSDASNPDKPLDAAWIVLEAANDLADHATVEACRRVIDANLNGAPASQADLHIVIEYFR
jgi:hypothetical protein